MIWICVSCFNKKSGVIHKFALLHIYILAHKHIQMPWHVLTYLHIHTHTHSMIFSGCGSPTPLIYLIGFCLRWKLSWSACSSRREFEFLQGPWELTWSKKQRFRRNEVAKSIAPEMQRLTFRFVEGGPSLRLALEPGHLLGAWPLWLWAHSRYLGFPGALLLQSFPGGEPCPVLQK